MLSLLCSFRRRPQPVHAEPSVWVGPRGPRLEAGLARKPPQAVDAELVRILGVQRLPLLERVALAGEFDVLALAAHQVHLDALLRGVVERAVPEAAEVEAGA